MRVAVAGGTGLVGSHTVAALERAGHEAVVLARSRGVDLTTGEGLAAALDGVAGVVDASNVLTLRRRAATAFFTATSKHLSEAGRAGGVGHHVVLSIVGVDRVPMGYYQGKVVQEQVVRSGPVPFTVLRATQFHEFPGQLLSRVRGPLAVLPRMRVQPVAAREVGVRLAELVVGEPLGDAPELAGPEVHDVASLARRVLQAQGSARRVLPVRFPGQVGRAMARGALLPTGTLAAGTLTQGSMTFAQWLAAEHGESGAVPG